MDIAFNNRAINAHLTTFFNPGFFGMRQYCLVDQLPGIGGQCFDVFLKRGFFKPFVGNADSTEAPDAHGIDQMKGHLFVCKAEQNLYNGGSYHLLGSHAPGATWRAGCRLTAQNPRLFYVW